VTRPAVSVVMPFAGDLPAAREAVATLCALETAPGDQLILADNVGIVAASQAGVEVVNAIGERSPAHARNAGAEHARCEWILFLDADCSTCARLLERFFAQPIADDVGALAGEVVPAGEGRTLAERYGAAKSFLSQRAHLAHPYLPRAVAANLLVRRGAFEQVGGFYEGMRAAEDTDFSWRLQRAGWRLELRPHARVAHRYRASVGELRAQWRGYAAGRAWLRRRYPGFEPEPAIRRGLRRTRRRMGHGEERRTALGGEKISTGRLERSRYLALDVLLAVEELAGFTLSNRPAKAPKPQGEVVLIADRFPAPGDPRAEFAKTLHGARVEATGRPDLPWAELSRELEISYREDDGAAARVFALLALASRHPLRCALDRVRREPGEPTLASLAPAAERLERQPRARIHALGGDEAKATARRLASLTGRSLSDPGRR
jgi:hypothetical protein